jgi:hypothetical protein
MLFLFRPASLMKVNRAGTPAQEFDSAHLRPHGL